MITVRGHVSKTFVSARDSRIDPRDAEPDTDEASRAACCDCAGPVVESLDGRVYAHGCWMWRCEGCAS